MPIMQQKLVKDFFEAVEVDRLITKGQVDIEVGIPILKDMIQYVIEDINTLDQNAKKTLDNSLTQLDKSNVERKNSISKRIGEPDDSIDDRNLKRRLLFEDHNKYRHALVLIQELCFKKGWFD